MQLVLASRLANVSAAQNRQKLAWELLNFPAGQAVQLTTLALEKNPGLQELQVEAPVRSVALVPAGQSSQSL